MLTLRDYQLKGLDTIRDALRLNDSVIYVLPTGGGKTALATVMAGNASSMGRRCMFLVHRRELIRQTQDAFTLSGIHYGTIQAGKPGDPFAKVHIGSIQTVVRRLEKLQRPDLLIVDECHHARAQSWSTVIKWAACKTVGLTATPCRLDGKGLRGHFDEIVMGPKMAELIKAGWLADYRVYAPATVDASAVRIRGRDFRPEELDVLMSKRAIIGDVVDHYKRITPGRQAIVFSPTVKHAALMSVAFNQAGVPSTYIYGDMPTRERDRAVEAFRQGDLQVITNVDIVGEGFDMPSVYCAILLRHTKSLSLYLQQVGRCLRPQEGKDAAIILDHVGNVKRHGYPDQDREWSLDGAQKPRKEMDKKHVQVKQCEACYAVVFQREEFCPYCGAMFETKEREVTEVDGELVEMDRKIQQKLRSKQQGQAQTLRELVELGKERGYKSPYGWARKLLTARGVRV